jgi:2',3'-cyclic-nucleotide 2'-phosphodiesterase (5'-nucleotidase family)
LRATFDLKRQIGKRLIELRIGDQPVDDRKTYRVATSSFLAEGGDLYQTFLRTKQMDSKKPLSEVVMEYFQKHREVDAPKMGRLVQTRSARQN